MVEFFLFQRQRTSDCWSNVATLIQFRGQAPFLQSCDVREQCICHITSFFVLVSQLVSQPKVGTTNNTLQFAGVFFVYLFHFRFVYQKCFLYMPASLFLSFCLCVRVCVQEVKQTEQILGTHNDTSWPHHECNFEFSCRFDVARGVANKMRRLFGLCVCFPRLLSHVRVDEFGSHVVRHDKGVEGGHKLVVAPGRQEASTKLNDVFSYVSRRRWLLARSNFIQTEADENKYKVGDTDGDEA